MLTVADALAMEELQGAVIVAGAYGASRTITWVHATGVPDAPDWLNGGELVLTTAINLPEGDAAQGAYMAAMAAKGVAAVALTVGRYIDRAPDHLRAAADAHGLPLIEIPYQARFVDIARALNQRIAQEHTVMLERALHIQGVLTRLVLDSGDLKALARTLAELINVSVSIETEKFEALASHNIADFDEARRYTLSEGRTDPRLIHALEARGVLDTLRRTLEPVAIPQMADVGLEMERILAPIVVNGNIYGYIWLIADQRPLSALDRMAITSGATVAALILLYQDAAHNAEASFKGGLVARLVEGDARSELLADQALRYGVDLGAAFHLLLVDRRESTGGGGGALYRRVNHACTPWRTVVGAFAGTVLVLVQATQDANAIAAAIAAQSTDAQITISGSHTGAAAVPTAYVECRDTLHIARRMNGAIGAAAVVRFDALGYLHTLYRAGAAALATNLHITPLRRLLDEQGADLFRTLEVYLDAGGNGVQTAELLCIHRSTLNYRLQRISEIASVDLHEPSVRLNLQVALKLLRLFDTAP